MSLEAIVKGRGRMGLIKKSITTSAVLGASPNKAFCASLEQYAKHENIDKIYILPLKGKWKDDELHDYFNQDIYQVINKNVRLNNNIMIDTYNVLPQQINPTTGLARFAQDDTSSIFGSSKQNMEVVPNSKEDLPKVLWTTGACTLPNYRDNRIGGIAKRDHVYGALVVETKGNKWYQVRNLESTKSGVFYDLGVRFDDRYEMDETPDVDALILGDLHNGFTCPKVAKASDKMMSDLKPKRVYIHDFMDSYSISHHNEHNLVAKYLTHKNKTLSLENELKALNKTMQKFSVENPQSEFYVVKSNHDEHLNRWLQETRFVKEPQNALIGSKLLTGYLEGNDPLKYGMELTGGIPDNFYFLKERDDSKVRGYQLGNHGHNGANGARGSKISAEKANGRSVSGHGHSPFKHRNTIQVGTSSLLNLPYVKGNSSWMNTHALIHPNSKAQLVNIVSGKYRF